MKLAGSPPSNASAQVRVLQSVIWSKGTNPYVRLLAESLPDGVSPLEFSWHRAIFGQYDILHMHWPEHLIRSQTSPLKSLVKTVLASALVARLRLTREPIVRTLHNLEPHEKWSKTSQRLGRRLDAMTTAWIAMDPIDATSVDGPVYVIPHGDYAPIFGSYPEIAPHEGLIVNFGHIRRYKGLEHLVDVVRDAQPYSQIRLRIVGPSDDAVLVESLVQSSIREPWLDVDPRLLSDEELATSIRSAELVVLPYEHLYNSGAAMLALTLSRPILLPETPMSTRLKAEVGDQWVHLYCGALSSRHLLDTLAVVRGRQKDSHPDLRMRNWSLLGREFASVYHERLAAPRR
ncbi:Glycosyltransferase involved in cell wall bisynthesis [Agromyces sp. CF514]|nr:Glycosyltransferase involved in cell wall bisynthesis [Agromyces sp. CF514]